MNSERDRQQRQQHGDSGDPVPWTEFRVAAAKAEKSAALYAEHRSTLAPWFGKIDGAAGRYDEKWTASRKAWDDLACRLERIGKVLTQAIGEDARTALDACWDNENPTQPATVPACTETDAVQCDECGAHRDLTELATYQQQAETAKECATTRGAAFTALADLPDSLPAAVKALDGRAGKLDDAMGAPGHDPRRSYVLFRQLTADVDALAAMLDRKADNPSAQYARRLDELFDQLLRTHRTWVCLALVAHELETRRAIDQELKAARATDIVDIVLACAAEQQATSSPSSPPRERTSPPGPPHCDDTTP
jgi:hypothetical protein